MAAIYDVAIIGGGINGCGCAADAALRGLSVILCEQDDLASKTSSSSTKLIHGGLRYLERYEFHLVKKALVERQILLDLAPYLVHPQAFVLPYQKNMRPAWLLRMGLFFYDYLSNKNTLPKSRTIFRKNNTSKFYFLPLLSSFFKGFLFYDAATDDARLTIANALQAKKYGAEIVTHSKLIEATVEQGIWNLTFKLKAGNLHVVKAKTVINATGPWVNDVANCLKTPIRQAITWVKGSHFVVPALYSGQQAYLLQHADGRVVFVIPYHGYSMVGTTDVAYTGSLNQIAISDQEIDYLCNLVNQFFEKIIKKEDIVQTWSGVRPLLANPEENLKSLSRDYKHYYNAIPAPVVVICGGKITTYRKLATEVIDSLSSVLGNHQASKTGITPLPGSFTDNKMPFNQYKSFAKEKYNWLNASVLDRYLSTYGTCTEYLLADCHNILDLGAYFGGTLYQIEVEYLIRQEWATSADDILWRRTKLGFELNASERMELENFIRERTIAPSSSLKRML